MLGNRSLFNYLKIAVVLVSTSFSFFTFATPQLNPKIFYVGTSAASFEVLKQSDLISEILISFQGFSVLKLVTDNPEALASLPYVDFIEEEKPRPVSSFRDSKMDQFESSSSVSLSNLIAGDYPWGIESIRAPEAWSYATGKGASLLILDSGIQEHPAILDSLVEARDFTNSEITKYVPSITHDITGHSTHVAATIVGNGFNKLYGVAPDADLYIGKVCATSCGIDSMLRGIEWAIVEKFDVVNMSFSSNRIPVLTAQRVFQMLEVNNTLVVSSSGNDGEDADHMISAPGSISTVLAVGAVDQEGLVTHFSNRGPELSLLAPGKDIVSAGKIVGASRGSLLQSKRSGTSMASPHVSGVGLLIKEIRPEMLVADIRKAILNSSVKTPISISDPLAYGAGILDALNAVMYVQMNLEVASN